MDDIRAGSTIEFDIQVPVKAETCEAQIARTLALKLPDALGRRKLTVVANGPSARSAPLGWPHTTLALNGAMKLFTDEGLYPTYWACCDPQPLVAEFLNNAPEETIYLVASKCHPDVFAALHGKDVRVWHLADHPCGGRLRMPLATSVTITASWLMQRLGYTDFDYYGWDGCYLDGAHHAGAAETFAEVGNITVNVGGKIVGDEVHGGENFATTHTWAAEGRDAEQFFQLAEYLGCTINIHGNGMMRALRNHILGDF